MPAPRPLDAVWQAPLVPVALAFTAGIILDRYLALDWTKSVATAAALLAAWGFVRGTAAPPLAAALLLGAVAAVGAFWHHWQVAIVPGDDIRFQISAEGTMARLRGRVDGAPQFLQIDQDEALRSPFPARAASTRFTFTAAQLQARGGWQNVGGRVQATVSHKRRDLNVGDEIEIVGRLRLPAGPVNPGGFDYAAHLRDERISAVLAAPDSPGALEVVSVGWPRSVNGWLGKIRAWGNEVVRQRVPRQHGVAAALLLGDTTEMTGDDWDHYLRTGVVHVLAISGQHMVVLSMFLWLLLRLCRVPRRWAALAITLFMFGYALMTGGRPPIMRAGWMAAVFTAGILLQRVVMPANTYAFAWLGIAVANPTAIFDTGLQLSFVAVAVLLWGRFEMSVFSPKLVNIFSAQQSTTTTALEAVIDETRSPTVRLLRRGIAMLAMLYLESAAIWLAVTPLVAGQQNVISPVALLIGPPVMLFSSLALLSGFLMLALSFASPLAILFGWTTAGCLIMCRWIVEMTMNLAGAYFFVPNIGPAWVIGFYLLLAAALTIRHVQVKRLSFAALALWTVGGGAIALWPTRPTEFRCTFLAVGHGGCVVFETPGGRVLVYDAGAITGPEVTRRDIAPYLWSRGIRRIDELVISHGDLDHFNGVPALLERFTVDRVALTPSFANRTTPGVGRTMQALERLGLEPRIVSAGQTWEVDGISFEALHPPAQGPEGNENARSLVLLVRYCELSLLLTGDLEGAGLTHLLEQPPRSVDVLQAPHHGSRKSNTPELAAWASPAFVVSSQGPPLSVPKTANPYEELAGARYLPTWPHGAVTIRPEGGGFVVETYHTGNQWRIERRSGRRAMVGRNDRASLVS
jgi:competence protein ComEC